jgi:CRP/FNR family transcriptional regulator, cyclic AMP receptor protein
MTETAERNIVEKVIALEAVDLLENLTPEQLARLAAIAREAHYPPGKTILEAGAPLEALYVILDGSVELARNGETLHTAHRGEVLGAWALFDPDPMAVSARTAEDTHLLRIARDDFYDLLADNVEITAAVFSTLVKRFRKLVEQ